jgi:hypothetical protein
MVTIAVKIIRLSAFNYDQSTERVLSHRREGSSDGAVEELAVT